MLATSRLTKELEGIQTDVLIQVFADQILVLVTQLGKVGSLIQATMPDTAPLLPTEPSPNPSDISLPPPSPSIQLTPVLGQAPSEHDQTLHSLYASQIATLVWTAEAAGALDSGRRGVIVGIALRKSSGEEGSTGGEQRVFIGAMGMVTELLKQP
ncbi:hypothetical protein BDY19DRAFT_989250 [Irpex rosettiformis]|uniref:Uncharacterized protein n=1 Tax=Irpex rosettiformis TaxID=378272 RepID=A0ACB8UHH5_9APHY|nr:hypothetical protein BDY19DRAFT_989250 [Irpex rosettiformis]